MQNNETNSNIINENKDNINIINENLIKKKKNDQDFDKSNKKEEFKKTKLYDRDELPIFRNKTTITIVISFSVSSIFKFKLQFKIVNKK